MSKLLKEDFDQFIDEEPMYSDEDKEKVFKKIRGRKRKIRPYFVTTAALSCALLIALLMVTDSNEVNQLDENKHELEQEDSIVDEEEEHEFIEEPYVWHDAKSREEVDTFYEELVPRIDVAEEYGLVTEVDQTALIEDLNIDLHVEKMWHTSNGIYFFYSIEEYEDFSSDRVNVNFVIENGLGRDSYYISGSSIGNKGVIFNGRLYQVARTHPFERFPEDDIVEFDQDTIVITPSLYIDMNGYTIEPIEVIHSYSREAEEQYTYEIPINKEISKNGITIILDRLDVGLARNSLYFKAENNNHENDELYYINGAIETDAGESRPITLSNHRMYLEEGLLKFDFDAAFDQNTSEINILFNTISFVSDESLEFSFDVSKYDVDFFKNEQTDEQIVNKYLGEVMQTRVYIDQYSVDGEGMFIPLRHVKLPGHPVTLSKYMTSSLAPFNNEDNPNTLVVTNEDGDRPSEMSFRADDMGNEGFIIRRYFLTGSEEVNIKWINLSYEVEINDSVKVDIE